MVDWMHAAVRPHHGCTKHPSHVKTSPPGQPLPGYALVETGDSRQALSGLAPPKLADTEARLPQQGGLKPRPPMRRRAGLPEDHGTSYPQLYSWQPPSRRQLAAVLQPAAAQPARAAAAGAGAGRGARQGSLHLRRKAHLDIVCRGNVRPARWSSNHFTCVN